MDQPLTLPDVRVRRTDFDPMIEGASFRYEGHVYQVTQIKSRGRIMIKHLGIVEIIQRGAANDE